MSFYSTWRWILLLIQKHNQSDLISNPLIFTTIWGVPTLVLICSTLLENKMIIGWIWAISFCWMGGACLFNAKQCKRTHCFYTGPFFILMAIISLLYSYDIIRLGKNGWILLGVISIAGGILIWNFSESIFGKYIKNWMSACGKSSRTRS